MVVFTCNHCGDSLQKPKVEKHYATVCRTAKFVTCVDCFKDFKNEEYAAHTKCITEEERYAAKGSLPQGAVKKGEVKQGSWTEMIKSIAETTHGATPEQQKVFNVMGSSSNVPRKKVKFINFITSSLGNRVKIDSIQSVWSLIEKAKAEQQQGSNAKKDDKANETEKADAEEAGGEDLPKKKKRKSKAAKENGIAGEQQIVEESDKNSFHGVEDASEQESPKKKKKKSKLNEENTVTAESTTNNSEGRPEANQEDAKHSTENGTDLSSSKKKKRKSKSAKQENDENQEGKTEIQETKSENNTAEDICKPKKRKSQNLNDSEAIENGISQKKKTMENGEISPDNINEEKPPESEVLNSSSACEFSFTTVILEILKGKNNISLKKLEKKVLNAYYKQTGTEHSEKAAKKFNKKLKKENGIEISENCVKLIDN